jgi:hypothetical protein
MKIIPVATMGGVEEWTVAYPAAHYKDIAAAVGNTLLFNFMVRALNA